jgi:hypothetical protein
MAISTTTQNIPSTIVRMTEAELKGKERQARDSLDNAASLCNLGRGILSSSLKKKS